MSFDVARARLNEPDNFQRFRVDGPGTPLSKAGASSDTWVVEIERAGERHGFYAHQLAYHHVAQGVIRGEPYAVSF